MINSIWTRRVPIDDATKGLYKREDAGSEFFYLRDFPPLQCLTEDKVLYVYVNTHPEAKRSVLFLDKFGIEWNMRLEAEIKELTFLGTPVAGTGLAEARISNFTYRTPMGIPLPTSSALPHQAVRQATTGPKISFVEERVHSGKVGESRPNASMHTSRTGGQ